MIELTTIIDKHKNDKGALLPILHDLQSVLGYIPDEAIDPIADALKLGRAEVFGVISFYHDFRKTPAGRHVLKICRAEACQSMGAEGLVDDILAAFGLREFGTTADGRVTIEAVYCLGLCAMSPAALVDGQPMGRASVARLKEAVK